MLFSSILITLTISLLLYIILYSQINKIKKDYVKKDLTEEMKDIITAFTEEADKSITILEDLIKKADEKIKKIEEQGIDIKKISTNDISKNNKDENNEKWNSFDNRKGINKQQEFDNQNFEPEMEWQEKAYRMYENGFNIEEISDKLKKLPGEIDFALKYIKLKKRLK